MLPPDRRMHHHFPIDKFSFGLLVNPFIKRQTAGMLLPEALVELPDQQWGIRLSHNSFHQVLIHVVKVRVNLRLRQVDVLKSPALSEIWVIQKKLSTPCSEIPTSPI